MRWRKGKPREVPYPPVFHDWRRSPGIDQRVATGRSPTGIEVEMFKPREWGNVWYVVELTEDDACLLAASLLRRADREDLAQKVLRGLGEVR